MFNGTPTLQDNMQVFSNEWAKAEKFMPQMLGILEKLGADPTQIRKGTPNEDINYGTDAVLTLGTSTPVTLIPSHAGTTSATATIAIRTRSYVPYNSYENKDQYDLTLRSGVFGGGDTELDKIRKGTFTDWYLYGWAKDGTTVNTWILVEMQKVYDLRLWENKNTIFNERSLTSFIPIPARELLDDNCVRAYGWKAKTHILN